MLFCAALFCFLLGCVKLGYVVPRCGALSHVVLRGAAACHVVLCCLVLCWFVLCSVVLRGIMVGSAVLVAVIRLVSLGARGEGKQGRQEPIKEQRPKTAADEHAHVKYATMKWAGSVIDAATQQMSAGA